jgi:hypothetical protein
VCCSERRHSASRGEQGKVSPALIRAKNPVYYWYLSIRISKKMEGAMGREEIIVLESSEDEPIGPLGLCCHVIYGLFRG